MSKIPRPRARILECIIRWVEVSEAGNHVLGELSRGVSYAVRFIRCMEYFEIISGVERISAVSLVCLPCHIWFII